MIRENRIEFVVVLLGVLALLGALLYGRIDREQERSASLVVEGHDSDVIEGESHYGGPGESRHEESFRSNRSAGLESGREQVFPSNPVSQDPQLWQILTEQNLSSGLSLQETADMLFEKVKGVSFDPADVEAHDGGILRYHEKDSQFAFLVSPEGENHILSLYYYFEPETIITIDGVERTTIGYSFHWAEYGYSVFVEAKSRDNNPNIWRGISYSYDKESGAVCTKFYPPYSQQSNDLYPVLGVGELSEQSLKAWKELMESLVKTVKTKEKVK